MSDELSAKMRFYLAEIYRLADHANDESFVSTSTLADELAVSAPAVNRMVNRLKEGDLLEHIPYQGVRLTESGKQEARKHLRNQRIAETFLVNVMGFDWDEVHDEAAQISVALSDAIAKRMLEMADNPTHSPRGEPIPNDDGSMPEMADTALADVEADNDVIITRLRTHESDRLNYLKALGLVPGVQLHVLHVAPFNGPMQLKIGEEYRIVGRNLAELIYVKTIQA